VKRNSTSPPKPVGAAAVIEETWSATPDRLAPVVHRPDGWYWIAPGGKGEFGPFATPDEARADRDRFDEQGTEPGESLREAEDEIGIADWIDPETGEPAEGRSPPHFEHD
jgi:hypothetical protein